MRSRRSRLVWILLAAFVLFLLVAVAAGVIYFLLQRGQQLSEGWRDPIAEIAPDEISAGWALYPLAGASELDTIDTALSSGDLETAYATLVFGLDLADGQRIGRLTLLGRRFAEAERLDRAALCYQQIYDVALVSPWLHDPARADALLASGQGWARLDRADEALGAYDQVYKLAVQSPHLQMAHRRDLLRVLESAYRERGEAKKAEACRERIIELDQQARPQPPASSLVSPDLPVEVEAVSSPEVGRLEEARRQAAFALIGVFEKGGEPTDELVAALEAALRAEDEAKVSLYREELETTSQLSKRINVHWHLVHWLTIKYQVAARGFGLSLVPDWEAQLPDIQSALSKAFEDLRFEYEDLVTALPEASLLGPGNYQIRRQFILAGRLGHYPNYPANQMANKLQDTVTGLIAAGFREELYLDVSIQEDGLSFSLSTADEYGLSAQSP